jgi:hypothetical protein
MVPQQDISSLTAIDLWDLSLMRTVSQQLFLGSLVVFPVNALRRDSLQIALLASSGIGMVTFVSLCHLLIGRWSSEGCNHAAIMQYWHESHYSLIGRR